MKALINSNNTYENGFYIQDIVESEFDVHSDMYFVDCSDDITRERHYYIQTSNTFAVRQEVLDAEAQEEELVNSEEYTQAQAESQEQAE